MTVMSSIKSYSELNFISFIKLNHRESLDKFLDTDRKKSVFFYVSTFSFKEAKRTFLIPWVIGLCTGISM